MKSEATKCSMQALATACLQQACGRGALLPGDAGQGASLSLTDVLGNQDLLERIANGLDAKAWDALRGLSRGLRKATDSQIGVAAVFPPLKAALRTGEHSPKLAALQHCRLQQNWALGRCQQQVLAGHTNLVYSVSSSPDGTNLASASDDRTVRLWDLSQDPPPAQVLVGHTGPVYSVSFSPDGTKLASASYDEAVRLWDFSPGVVPS